jgi:hypothetical protein
MISNIGIYLIFPWKILNHKHYSLTAFCLFFVAVLRGKLRALYMLGKHSITELHTRPSFTFVSDFFFPLMPAYQVCWLLTLFTVYPRSFSLGRCLTKHYATFRSLLGITPTFEKSGLLLCRSR